jgi:hypothetical protein
VGDRRLRPDLLGVDRGGTADDVVADAVLRVRRRGRRTEEARAVRLVLAEEQVVVAVGGEDETAELVVLGDDRAAVVADLQQRSTVVTAPRPRVAEPQRREEVEGRLVGPGVADPDLEDEVVGRRLGDVDGDLEVAVVVEDTGVEQLVLGLVAAPAGVHVDEVGVGERRLRVHVAPLHPGVRRGGVEVPPVLLGVLAVVALRPGKPEDPLLQDRVAPVPHRQPETQDLLAVGQPAEAVLVPPVGARTGVIVGERRPRVAARRVVLAHRPPGSFGQIRAPSAPRRSLVSLQPIPLSAHSRNPRVSSCELLS